MKKKKLIAEQQLEKILGEKFSFAMMMRAYRTREDLTQEELSKKIKVPKSYISNLENKRDFVTVDQAKKIAKILKEPVELWVEVALQDMLDRAGINAIVKLVA